MRPSAAKCSSDTHFNPCRLWQGERVTSRVQRYDKGDEMRCLDLLPVQSCTDSHGLPGNTVSEPLFAATLFALHC